MSKAMLFSGRDEFGVIRPIYVTHDGHVKIDAPYSYEEDDFGNPVLRVVDAAPYLVEYGMYDTLSSYKNAVTPAPSRVLDENAKRKYASIYNNGDGFIVLSAGNEGSESGIVIAPHERYEMSVLRGNLHRGAMYLCALDVATQTVKNFVQGGIGNSGFSESLIRTHTDYIPVSIPENGLGVAVSVESSIVSIRNVATFDVNHNLVTYQEGVDQRFPMMDGVYTKGSFTVTNPVVAYIAVSFCRSADTSVNLSPEDMTDTTLTIKSTKPSTAYIAEGV